MLHHLIDPQKDSIDLDSRQFVDNSELDSLTDKITAITTRHLEAGSAAVRAAEAAANAAEQTRWDNFAAGRSLDESR